MIYLNEIRRIILTQNIITIILIIILLSSNYYRNICIQNFIK